MIGKLNKIPLLTPTIPPIFCEVEFILDFIVKKCERYSPNSYDPYLCHICINYKNCDKIKLMEDGRVGHLSLWLTPDDCAVEGVYWKTQPKEDFEKWVNLISQEEHLEDGYLPVWHKEI